MKILIIGSGAYGVAAAWAFQARGHQVTVIEQGLFASGATPLAAGIISRQCWDLTDAALVEETQSFYEKLGHEFTGNMEVRVDGMLRFAFSDRTAAALHEETEALRGAGFAVDMVTKERALKLAPVMELEGLVAAAYDPRDAYGDPYGYVYIACAILAAKGVTFTMRAAAKKFKISGGRCTGIELASGETLTADLIVMAAGAGGKRIMQASELPLPVKPYRTQAAILDLGWSFPLIGHDLDSGLYFRREGKGHLLVGDGTEPFESDLDAWNPKADSAFLESIPERITTLIPRAGEAGLMRGWAGLCVSTPDRRPLLGNYPGVSGLAIFCGDNGFGFMRAPALGEAFAGEVLGESPRHDLTHHRLSRYAGALAQDFAVQQGFNLPCS